MMMRSDVFSTGRAANQTSSGVLDGLKALQVDMKVSQMFLKWKGFSNGNQDKKSNGNGNKPYTHGKPNDGQPHGPSNVPLRCEKFKRI